MESGAEGKAAQGAVCSRVAAGRVAAHDRATIDSDHGITSRTVLETNASSTPPRSAKVP
jgi:hypothetical protein